MKILITGAGGFIGKNLVAHLQALNIEGGDIKVLEYHHDMGVDKLYSMISECDFICHLAGVNRPKNDEEFRQGNVGFTRELLYQIKRADKILPIIVISSIQATLDNPYGRSKYEAECMFCAYGKETGAHVYIYRLPGVFGKWCKPNYNSVVATFSHHIARDMPICIDDVTREIDLVYIDDVVNEICHTLQGNPTRESDFCVVPIMYRRSLGDIAELLYSFHRTRNELSVPNQMDDFTRKLYATYLSYLPDDAFCYDLAMHVDERGSFTEFIRTCNQGQFSVNISHPSVVKGNHWHRSKHEKFLVVSGTGIIRFRKVNENKTICYHVSGEKLQVVEIPPGYTHNIENTGNVDMVTLMWVNECYDSEKPDTVPMKI